ncbi:hypothetical protein AB0L63_27220 [Nocardia sp. NPDC051990]
MSGSSQPQQTDAGTSFDPSISRGRLLGQGGHDLADAVAADE